jgi:hypothetical protein
MVRKERFTLESDLRALDEALRFGARAARWPEGDTGAGGIPPDEIQQHPVGIFADFKLDELPIGSGSSAGQRTGRRRPRSS